MKIKSIQLNNFQSHEKTHIVFSPGITTIRGSSDMGKSAVVRGLSWACLNNLAGEGFVREGTKKTTVTVEAAISKPEKRIVTITRSKGIKGASNTYAMDEAEFKAFGRGKVPDDIARTLSLSPINFQGQHDSPFWFSETAGEVSRQLNSVIDLSVIDQCLSDANGRVRKADWEVKLHKEELSKLEESLKGAEDIDRRVNSFEKLDELRRKQASAVSSLEEFKKLLEAARSNRFSDLKKRAEQGKDLLHKATELRRIEAESDFLRRFIKEIEKLKQVQPPPDFSEVEKLHKKWTEVEKKMQPIRWNLKQAVIWERLLEKAEHDLHEAQHQLEKETKGKRCPVCSMKIS